MPSFFLMAMRKPVWSLPRGHGSAAERGHTDDTLESAFYILKDWVDRYTRLLVWSSPVTIVAERANVRDRVRQPDPSLVVHEHATEPGELVDEGFDVGHGPDQLDVADHWPDGDQLDRPVAEHLIRQAEIAAGCVRRFRHGVSVLLVPPLAGAPMIVRQVFPLGIDEAASQGGSGQLAAFIQ